MQLRKCYACGCPSLQSSSWLFFVFVFFGQLHAQNHLILLFCFLIWDVTYKIALIYSIMEVDYSNYSGKQGAMTSYWTTSTVEVLKPFTKFLPSKTNSSYALMDWTAAVNRRCSTLVADKNSISVIQTCSVVSFKEISSHHEITF